MKKFFFFVSVLVLVVALVPALLLRKSSSSYNLALPSSNIKVSLAAASNTAVVAVEKGQTKVNFETTLQGVTLEKKNDKFVYKDDKGAMEIRYHTIPKGFKEEIVLNQPVSINPSPPAGGEGQVKFDVEVTLKDAVVQRNLDGQPVIFDKNGKYQFHFQKPFAQDAKGEKTYALSYSLNNTGDPNNFLLTLVVDQAWLSDPKRVYPIIIDPTIIDDEGEAKLEIITVHSHPQAGDNWVVSFETVTAVSITADLIISPVDQPTIDDLEFVSLTCGEEERTPQILEGDVIFYPNWQCDEIAAATHLVNVARKHTLKFQFGGQTAYAYNNPDTEILRPNAAGDETAIPGQYPDSGEHWDKVDEAVADDPDTYVISKVSTYSRDLYNLPASSGSGTINKITVYFRCYGNPGTSYAKASIKSDGIVTDGTAKTVAQTSVWETLSQIWATNPADSQQWEWADIDALQIGVSIRGTGPPPPIQIPMYCTQVYVEVDYTPPPPPPGTRFEGVKMKGICVGEGPCPTTVPAP